MILGTGIGIGFAGSGGGGAAAAKKTLVTDTFVASGTWTRPAFDFWHPDGTLGSVSAEAWGSGGGGTTATGAGGGGAYARGKVAPAGNVAVTVGAVAVNANGGDSSFGALVVAQGGRSGTNGGAGGAAASSTGDTKFDGGAGAQGAGTNPGGGGAGSAAAGVTSTPGAPDGGAPSSAFAGIIGAGGGSTAAGQTAGQRGEVRVSYEVAAAAGFPRVRGRSVGRAAADGTSLAVTMPSDIQPGERLVLLVASDGVPTITVAGWTKVGQANDGTNAVTLALFHKIAAGSDTATIATSASEQVAYEVLRIADGNEPEWTTATGSSTNADPPSHTDSRGSAKALFLAVSAWDYNGLINITGFPANYGSAITVPPALSTGAVLSCTERLIETATQDPGTFTSGNEQWVAATVSIPFL